MLSYRHAFHAGNHADVLKHLTLVLLLRHLNQKDKPWWFIDTHAGAGLYPLDSTFARKNAEFNSGIGQLWPAAPSDLPPALVDYLSLVRQANGNGALKVYPGSPWFAHALARPDDRLRLFELHGSDYRLLVKQFTSASHQVQIREQDGFDALKSLLPPPSRRGLILIDPPYENKADYQQVITTLTDAFRRFAHGIYAVWYPLLQRREAHELAQRLRRKSPGTWLDVRLAWQTPARGGFGMHGCGLFIANPPWTLHEQLAAVLPELTSRLALDEGAQHFLQSGDNSTPPSGPEKRIMLGSAKGGRVDAK